MNKKTKLGFAVILSAMPRFIFIVSAKLHYTKTRTLTNKIGGVLK